MVKQVSTCKHAVLNQLKLVKHGIMGTTLGDYVTVIAQCQGVNRPSLRKIITTAINPCMATCAINLLMGPQFTLFLCSHKP